MKKTEMKKSNFYVYIHVKPHTGEIFYVGKGKGKRAYSKHDRNKFWHNIVNKYGLDIFILENNLTEEEAFKLEEQYIESVGRRDLNTGTLVNMTDGGDGIAGHKHSEESKRKMSETAKKIWESEEHKQKMTKLRIGRKSSEKTRLKMSEAHKQRWKSEEVRQKVSKSLKGNRNAKGYKHSEEALRKISEAAKGRKLSEETKKKMSEAQKKRWTDRKAKTAE